eukprot:gene7532-569_t
MTLDQLLPAKLFCPDRQNRPEGCTIWRFYRANHTEKCFSQDVGAMEDEIEFDEELANGSICQVSTGKGVPSFYRWLSRKYPKCIVDAKEDRPQTIDGQYVPVDTSQPNPNDVEFDNLYLDMNGIIHPASHPEDRPAPETEDDMFVAVLEYLDRVFACVRPRKLLFIAIDGVAPRAKMNQQRSRRFKSAKERILQEQATKEIIEEWRSKGREIPKHRNAFDSNVITPGTPFMDRLAGIDATVPGEGEHKIMDFIRRQRLQRDYNSNTSHVVHGLDADLILLALATHEPHFTILREEVVSRKPEMSTKQKAETELEVRFVTIYCST